MNNIARRVERLETASPARPVHYLWDNGIEPLDRLLEREAEMAGRGFDVIRIGWEGRIRDAQS